MMVRFATGIATASFCETKDRVESPAVRPNYFNCLAWDNRYTLFRQACKKLPDPVD